MAVPTAADLFVAVARHDVFAVERMINSGMNLDEAVGGATPLGLSVYRGRADLVELLVNAGADVNLRSKDHLGRIEPPLCAACRLGNRRILELLFNSPRVDPNQKDFFNKTPLWIAAKERRYDLVELLLEKGASVNVAEVWCDCPLYLSTKYRGRSDIAELLIRKGCRVDNADSEGRSPIYWTMKRENRRLFELLVRAGAKIQTPDWLHPSRLPPAWQKDPVFRIRLEKLRTQPVPLAFLARTFVRRWLSLVWDRLDEKVVETLPIPRILVEFLLLGRGD